jgi:hypothetical protein
VGSRSLPVPMVEIMVVLVDIAVLKLSVALNPFPGDGYRGVAGAARCSPPASWMPATVEHGPAK